MRQKQLVGNAKLKVLLSAGRKQLSEIIPFLQILMLGDLHCYMLALCYVAVKMHPCLH